MLRARLRQADAIHDLAQDTLVAVILAVRKGQVREPDRLPGFVQGVARNLANNHLRGVTRRAEAPFDAALEATLAARDDRDEDDRRAAVARGLEAIAPADREVLQLTLVEGLAPRDIAHRLNLSSDVVRTRKSRALMRLRAALDDPPAPSRSGGGVDASGGASAGRSVGTAGGVDGGDEGAVGAPDACDGGEASSPLIHQARPITIVAAAARPTIGPTRHTGVRGAWCRAAGPTRPGFGASPSRTSCSSWTSAKQAVHVK
jgi:RNA polymerase sigma-70 factor (ECF subfamily)